MAGVRHIQRSSLRPAAETAHVWGSMQNTLNSKVSADLLQSVADSRESLIELAQQLVQIPTESPESDTAAAVRLLSERLARIDDVCIEVLTAKEPVRNLMASFSTGRPGRRLVLNGHLDTYPAGNPGDWSASPFSGHIHDGRLYGRGSADMKAGASCLVHAFEILAGRRDQLCGETVLTLAGDEETMGELGSEFLLKSSSKVRGDAVLNADVGSPIIPRVGEKGLVWVKVTAAGKAAHGAHVHKGENAISRLKDAIDAVCAMEKLAVDTPEEVARTIAAAAPVSERSGGIGESSVLKQVTVNIGRISGGISANLVPDRAEFEADIRLPMGVSVRDAEDRIAAGLSGLQGIQYEIIRRYAPTWTSPDSPIALAVANACETVLGSRPAVNMRVGASDARLFRARDIPTVVCGLTPYNLGAPDEYVMISEIEDVAGIHLLAAAAYQSRELCP